MPKETRCTDGNTYIVEFDGKPSLVKEIVKGCTWITVGFELFRADLDRKMWVRMESIGDKVLMLAVTSVSLLAADIGGRGNCIYFSQGRKFMDDSGNCGQAPWKVFDMGTGRVTDLLLPNPSQIEKYPQQLFVPSLC